MTGPLVWESSGTGGKSFFSPLLGEAHNKKTTENAPRQASVSDNCLDGRGHIRLWSAWVLQPRWADCWSRSSLGQYEDLLMKPLHPCGSWPRGSFQQLHLGHRLGLLHLVTLVPQWSIRDSQSINQGHLLLPTLKSWLSSASDDSSFHPDILVLERPMWIRSHLDTSVHIPITHFWLPSLSSDLPWAYFNPYHLWLSGLPQKHLQGSVPNRGSQSRVLWSQAQFRFLCLCCPRYVSHVSHYFQGKKKAELLEWPQVKMVFIKYFPFLKELIISEPA